MALPTTLHATDESVAIRAGADFADLAPADQALAAGNDGVFGSGDRWTLTSASVASFSAQGVAAGNVAMLQLPRQGIGGDELHLLVVASVSGGSLTLRRKGLAAGAGQPPSPVGGVSGVQFTVATMYAEIQSATFDVNHRLGIDDTIVGRRVADLADVTQLSDATVLTVLWRRYLAIARKGGPDDKGAAMTPEQARAASYWAKARAIRQELDDVLGRLSLKWSASNDPGASAPPTTRFGMRMTR